jgi:hypothetical protein
MQVPLALLAEMDLEAAKVLDLSWLSLYMLRW